MRRDKIKMDERIRTYEETIGLIHTMTKDNTGSVCAMLAYIYDKPYDKVKEDIEQ